MFKGALFLSWLLLPGIRAQETVVPVDIQFALFSKILSFDRNLKNRVGDEIVFGILYQGKNATSLEIKKEIEKVVPFIKQIDDIPIEFEWIDLSAKPDAESAFSGSRSNIFYLTPLIHTDIKTIIKWSRRRGIITLTGVEEYVEQGLSIGIALKEKKPWPVINLPAARAEGADFDSKLLNLSKVIE
jgi:hypothetical protein